MFVVASKFNIRCMQGMFVPEFLQVYVDFLVVAVFVKTDCYSPSNLLVRSATCGASGTISHDTYCISITPVLSSLSKRSLRAKANQSLKVLVRIFRHTGTASLVLCAFLHSCLTVSGSCNFRLRRTRRRSSHTD